MINTQSTEKNKKQLKYNYVKVIQFYSYEGWEDVCEYEANSKGEAIEFDRNGKKLINNDLKEYRLSNTGAYKVIFRRELNKDY